jgi:thymidylate synthase
VVQIFDSHDLQGTAEDVPCTCTLQFLVRDDRVQMLTNMRSNDIYYGLVHDVFAFTMIQELVASSLSLDVGTYKHFVASLHLYDDNRPLADQFLDEGWQSTQTAMPPMPIGDPWVAVRSLLDVESRLRTGGEFCLDSLDRMDPYWADLGRLLYAFRARRNNSKEELALTNERMSSQIYLPFIDGLAARVADG